MRLNRFEGSVYRRAMSYFRAELRGQRTIILTTHRLESLAACDRIFVLQDGRIVEEGAPAELIARKGLYARMRSAKEQPRIP